MSGPARQWFAMAFAPREAHVNGGFRDVVERACDDASRVVRLRDGIVTAVHEGAAVTDPGDFVEGVRAAIATATADPHVAAGVSVPRERPSGLGVAALQAEQALLLGRTLRGEGRTTAFSDLGPYCFVLGQPTSDIRHFCSRVLGPLGEDQRHEDLVRTLEAYLRSHGSLNAVARELYLHRNTVRQRLRRIATLTGADLKDADSRLALHLAVLGRRALDQMSAQ